VQDDFLEREPDGSRSGMKTALQVAERRTIADFSEQWSRYPSNEGFYASAELLADILGPLLTLEELKDRTVLEVGSGTGRIVNMLFAAGVRHVYAVEPAPVAFEALKRNTAAHREQICYLNQRGDELPPNLELDLVLSIGVIHHIPDPQHTLRQCYRVLRPGGQIVIWVYGKEGNELYLKFLLPLRRVTVHLPHWLLAGLSHALNSSLSAYIGLCRRFQLPLRDYAVNVLGRMTRDKRYLVIYDQLNPTHAAYYTKQEVQHLLADAGFTDIRLHHRRGYSWTALGVRD
jgi:SAM-dependent methyltransferase